MKKLQILRVDNDLVQKVDLQIGNNIIGQNVATGCDNGQTVNHAVTINLTADNEMTITPSQVSSCYMKSSESPRWQLLELGNTVPIKPGDVCSLIPHKCWFKIISVPDKLENNEEYTLKRKANNDVNSDVSDKKFCSESGEGDNLRSSSDVLNKMLSNKNDVAEANVEENITNENNSLDDKNEGRMHDVNRKATCESRNTDQLYAVESVCNLRNVKEETSVQHSTMASTVKNNENVTKNAQPSVSADLPNVSTGATLNTRREKCKYAEKCYRRNPQHRAKFSHPNDSDYDVPDNRKECPYGTKCYRKNPQHKTEFKHVDRSNVTQRGRGRRKQTQGHVSEDTLFGLEDSSGEESVEESVDESEYTPSSDGESTDYDELYSESEDYTTD
ncbi:Aprataxin and PNK-like factor [Anthophora retusa]